MFTEILGMVGFGVALVLAWATRYHSRGIDRGLSYLVPHRKRDSALIRFALAGLIGIFTIIGFELAANVSEEAISARA